MLLETNAKSFYDVKQKLPILVYITGHTFGDGANSWMDPSALVSFGNVIVVLVQYRLGPFGWLSFLRSVFLLIS